MSNEIKISVVTPAYKCSGCIEVLYQRLRATMEAIKMPFELIFVNDASPENDWEIIQNLVRKDKRVKGVNLSRNFGQHYAITAGLNYVRGDWIVVMDCDLQDQPEEIPKLLRKAQEGNDVVFGRRHLRKDFFLKRVLSRIFIFLYSYLTEQDNDGTVANFGIFSAKVINNYKNIREQYRSFPIFIKWLGFKTSYVNVEHSERFAGRSAYTWNKLFSLAVDTVVSQSNKPLKLSIKFGFLMAVLSFIYGIYLITRYLVFNIMVEGWTSIMVSMFFLSGLSFANMGLLGLYIGKTYDEAKRRPLFVIMETLGMEDFE